MERSTRLRTLSSRRRRLLWGARDESTQLDFLGRERRPRCEALALRRPRRRQLHLQRIEGACRVVILSRYARSYVVQRLFMGPDRDPHGRVHDRRRS